MSRLYGVMLAIAVVAGCRGGHSDDHTHEAPAAGHGHGHGGGIALTHWTEQTELFVEFDPLVVGQGSEFAAHLTVLADFSPLAAGTVTVVLSGGGSPEERFSAEPSDTPGIFRPVATPAHAGARDVTIEVHAPGLDAVHDIGSFTVYASAAEAPEAEEEEDGGISFLKEQQWKMEFSVEPVARRSLRATLPVFGHVRARPDGEAIVTAPSAGRVLATSPLPSIGATVAREDRLAVLAPVLGAGTDLASLELAVDRARVALEHANRELARVTALRDQGAVSDRRVSEETLERDQAAAELSAARRRVSQFRRLQRPGAVRSRDHLDVRAPISGTVVEVRATPGAFVDDGAALFRIVDPAALRVQAFVPEADLDVLSSLQGAWVWLTGLDAPPIELGPDALVSSAGPVDHETHAVEVLFTLPAGVIARMGQPADVQLVWGEAVDGPSVPYRSIVWHAGLPYAYVMTGGESFERRQLRLGPREGRFVAVELGLDVGERVVVEGVDVVALAESAPAAAGHGHPH